MKAKNRVDQNQSRISVRSGDCAGEYGEATWRRRARVVIYGENEPHFV